MSFLITKVASFSLIDAPPLSFKTEVANNSRYLPSLNNLIIPTLETMLNRLVKRSNLGSVEPSKEDNVDIIPLREWMENAAFIGVVLDGSFLLVAFPSLLFGSILFLELYSTSIEFTFASKAEDKSLSPSFSFPSTSIFS